MALNDYDDKPWWTMGTKDQDDTYDVNEAMPAPTTMNGDKGAAY